MDIVLEEYIAGKLKKFSRRKKMVEWKETYHKEDVPEDHKEDAKLQKRWGDLGGAVFGTYFMWCWRDRTMQSVIEVDSLDALESILHDVEVELETVPKLKWSKKHECMLMFVY